MTSRPGSLKAKAREQSSFDDGSPDVQDEKINRTTDELIDFSTSVVAKVINDDVLKSRFVAQCNFNYAFT